MLGRCVSYQGSNDNIAAVMGHDYAKIYTDWANYYLERVKSKRKVTDLSADCRDGLLLAEVIEAVTSFKVPDLAKKPKNQQHMYDNCRQCLNVLRSHGVGGLDNITTNDICAGRLKAVLALFFALSRYKQQSKQSSKCGGIGSSGILGSGLGSGLGLAVGGGSGCSSTSADVHQPANNGGNTNSIERHQRNRHHDQQKHQQSTQQQQQLCSTTPNANVVVSNTTNRNSNSHNSGGLETSLTSAGNAISNAVGNAQLNGNDSMVNRQIPTAYGKSNGGTAIPLPATVMVQRRCPPDKVRPLPPTPNHTPSIPGLGKNGAEFNTSRPNSPPTSNHTIQSLKSGNNNGLRPPSTKAGHQSGIPSPGSVAGSTPTTATQQPGGIAQPTPQKHSMLDKLKLFNKEKQQQQQQAAAVSVSSTAAQKHTQSKRTSSSSGFSSARSERSDSSLSLNDGHGMSQIKPPAVSVSSSMAAKSGKSGSGSTKQSKLLAAQMKKEQLKANKLERKERSPARSITSKDEASGSESRHSTMSRTKNSLPRVSEKNSTKTSSRSSLNSRCDSKNSLVTMPAASANVAGLAPVGFSTKVSSLHSPSGTGLPKPIAAIKGTTKLPQSSLLAGQPPTMTSAAGGAHPGGANQDFLKREKSDISYNHTHISGGGSSDPLKGPHGSPQRQASAGSMNVHTLAGAASRSPQHIVKPIAMPPSSGAPTANGDHMQSPFYANTAHISAAAAAQQQIDSSASLGLGSPFSRLPPPKTATGLQPLSAPSSAHATPTRKLEYNSGPGVFNPLRSPMRSGVGSLGGHHSSPATPTGGVTPTGGSPSKFHTIPTKIVGTIYEEEKPVSVLPMRPLLRGYNSHVTLPTRGSRGGAHYLNGGGAGVSSDMDFGETDYGQSGYCSDGDALRLRSPNGGRAGEGRGGGALGGVGGASRYHDIDNGYLSEGSCGVGMSTDGGGGGGPGPGAGKHFLSLMRARTQLPTTIEERIRSSHGSLDSLGTASGGAHHKMDGSHGGGSGHGSANGSPHHQQHHHQQQQHQQQMNASPSHRSSSRNGRDNWTKMPEPLNGHHKQSGGEKNDLRSSPSHSRRSLGSATKALAAAAAAGGQQVATTRTKGVPPSFGYVKRANGCGTATAEQQSIVLLSGGGAGGSLCGAMGQNTRTAHVSAVPRTSGGRKMSGGAATLPNDMSKMPPSTQHRSFSLTGPGATQLSQSIRERLASGSHSLPKPGTDLHLFQPRVSSRTGKLEGSLSDTQTYAEVKPEYSTYAMWLKHSNTAGSRLSEGDSLDSMQMGGGGAMGVPVGGGGCGGSPSAMARHNHKMMQHRNAVAAAAMAAQAGAAAAAGMAGSESPYVQSPRMNRSNSIRSTKSEKMYPSMLSRGPDVEIEPYYCLPVGTVAGQNGTISAHMAAAAAAAMQKVAGQGGNPAAVGGGGMAGPGAGGGGSSVTWSQPTSPTPINRGFGGGGAGLGGTLSPTHAAGLSLAALTAVGLNTSGMSGGGGAVSGHRLTYPKKNDEVHGSAASLLSGGSSLYGSAEERQAHEIRRLKRELMEAREQVLSLSSQLSTNAHVVSAFEQSLSNMTNRLQHLTATAERKDGELTDMRQTIELLRKQSIQAGLTTAHMQSMGVQTQGHNQNELLGPGKAGTGLAMGLGVAGAISSNPGTPQHASRLALQQQQLQQAAVAAAAATNGSGMQRHHSSDSMCSLNSISSGCSAADKKKQKKTGWLRSSFTKAFSRNAKITKTNRHHGGAGPAEGGSVLGSHGGSLLRSGATNGHGHGAHHHLHGHEPAGLAALATQPAPPGLPQTPSKGGLGGSPAKMLTLIENAKPIDAIDPQDEQHMVDDLKKQLREKDLVLTDIRLEALSSASQLESLKETVNKMRAEMMSLKQNNERLQKLVTTRSLAGSEASLGNAISPNGSIGGESSRRYSLATDGSSRPPMDLPNRLDEELEEDNCPPAPAPDPPQQAPHSPTTHIDLTPPPPALEPLPANSAGVEELLPDVTDGKKIAIACYLGQPESYGKYCEELAELDEFYASSALAAAAVAVGVDGGAAAGEGGECAERKTAAYPAASLNEFVVAYTYISGKTTWQNLDYIVRKTFKDYVSRIDPGTNLGLNTDSITSYHLGEAKRGPEMGFPELLPCGYIVGNVRTLYICLQGVGSLAFDSLIPRSIVHRYISLLTEHRRLILCGPSGTGKSYLARRLAEFLVARSGRGNPSEAIATFNVDHKSSKELRQYLGHIAEQAAIANGISELPTVIILDNLHHASALGDVFSCLLSAGPAAKLPCIIGTMSQATCNTTNLQLHHNFRWVLTANHMEPVKGFLGRFLRRRLFQLELQTQHGQPELAAVLAWLPTVWQHINRFLETHSSSDVTIGPRLFLACPLDLKDSQVWFTDIWNYHLSPYLVEAVREGVQLYGRRGGAWNDPSAFIRNSYPWPYGPDSVPPLRQINAEDVGLEGVAASNGDNPDPLLNMLMRLQEAANYSENQDAESDCASLDSNITPDSSAGAE